MSNLKDLIKEALGDKGVTVSDIEMAAVPNEKDDEGKGYQLMCWEEAAKIFDYEFDSGYGGEEAHRFWIWTRDWIFFKGTYDGMEWVTCVPRNPLVDCSPYSIGGE